MEDTCKAYPAYHNPILQDFNRRVQTRFGHIIDKFSKQNVIVIPSFVDVHVHLREPGFFYKETMHTGTLAAAKGGYGIVFSMPNLDPVPDSLAALQVQLELIQKEAVTEVRPYGAITRGEQGLVLSRMAEMAPYVIGFSDDGVGLNDPALMEKAMETAKALGKPIVAHCEDLALRKGGYIHDGTYAKAHNHAGICSESEWRPIQRDLKLAAKTGCSYHVCHVSAKESLQLIRQAKAKGVNVTCETAPHYLLLCEEDLQEDGRFKMNPPLRSRQDQQALIAGILDGTIDMIATDHAPHTAEEKSKGLENSAMGITGLETAFPVLYTHLVRTDTLSLERLVELMCINPRKRFSLPPLSDTTDFALWEVGQAYTLDPTHFVSMGKSTPFAGQLVYGRCLLNIKNDNVLWQAT